MEDSTDGSFSDSKYEWRSGFYTKTLAFSISLGRTRTGYIAVVFNEIQNFMVFFFGWNEAEKNFYQGFITSVTSLGGMFGMLINLAILKKHGRKFSSLVIDIVSIIGILITLIANPGTMILGRFILGLAAGGDSVLVPIYLKEISTHDRRGLIMGMSGFLWIIGVLISYLMDLGLPKPDDNGVYTELDNQWWRVQFAFPLLFALVRITLVNLVYNYETPMHVFQSKSLNREFEAMQALAKIIRSDMIPKYMEDVICETQECRNRKFVTVVELFGYAYRRAIILLCIMGIFVTFSGGSLTLSYLPKFIESQTNEKIDVMVVRGLKVAVGVSLIFAAGFNMVFTDAVGRRNFLLAGGVLLSGLLYLLAILNWTVDQFFAGNVVLVFFYLFSSYITYNSAYSTYYGEILPDIGVTFMSVYLAAISFVMNFMFPALFSGMGRSGVQLVFALSTTASFFFVYLFLPSTKNTTFSRLFAAFHGPLVIIRK